MAANRQIIILGGGIAGIAAASRLLQLGYQVEVIESRRFLGGRSFSFTDPVSGSLIDNGQHVFIPACHHFLGLLSQLGVRDRWYQQPSLNLPVLNRLGEVSTLRASWLPAPFHLLPSFCSYSYLDLKDKLNILRAMARAMFLNRHEPTLEHISFQEWLIRRGQSERSITYFWNLLIMPTLNDHVRDVSAAMGLMIIQEGVLKGRHAADLGYPMGNLAEALGMPAQEYLVREGAGLTLGVPVRTLEATSEGVAAAITGDGCRHEGLAFLSALPFQILLKVLPPEVLEEPYFRSIAQIENSPIVNVYVWYDRPVMNQDFVAVVDSPLQWVFNKSHPNLRSQEQPGGCQQDAENLGQQICVSLSAAWEYKERSREETAEEIIDEMARVFPGAAKARVLRFMVVKQPNATFRCLPGVNEHRPGSVTPLPNFFIAGEWTDTGWPSTMESATRSGYNAAAAVIAKFPM